jgi:outer membrane immunogenic protein
LNVGADRSSGKFSVVPNQAGFPGGGAFSPQAAALFTSLLGREQPAVGFTGGGQFGYLQQRGSLVFGGEADLAYTDAQDTFSAIILPARGIGPGAGFVSQSYRTNFLSTVRARVGYVSGPVLWYGTGGLAMALAEFSNLLIGGGATSPASVEKIKVGYAVGGGAEWKVAPRWSVKIEYLHVDLGSETFQNGPPPAFPNGILTTTVKLREDIARVGFNFKL